MPCHNTSDRLFVYRKKNLSDMQESNNPEKFVPRGAIAFFALLVTLGLIIWFGIYFIMLSRI